MSADKGEASAVEDGAADGGAYRVLARKYRPQHFSDLIGQDAMVRTLTNAFETGRIAQAYMLTGVRGVGKTTTARLIARALNYARGDEDTGPRIDISEMGEHCQAIMESRHVDVIEMDAASNTGINDVREIIESARYRPVSARYKVYIIDEVHMLSRQAFNGLLKTLEEPPEHVKFIFATTEVQKVPVTVLSRCQRFDLRRIEANLLSQHLESVAGQEGAKISPDALALIVRAAEGSVRDGLSLLDQAIALSGETIEPGPVRDMLGLADRARIIDLFEHVMAGRVGEALKELEGQYSQGADPAVLLRDLADFTHLVTRLKLVEEAGSDRSLAQDERDRGLAFAASLTMAALTRTWQMLLKGFGEVQAAPDPWAAADMVVIRLAHAASLPTPDQLIRSIQQEAGGPQSAAPEPVQTNGGQGAPAKADRTLKAESPTPPPADVARATLPVAETGSQGAQPARKLEPEPETAAKRPGADVATFADLVALARDRRDVQLVRSLEHMVQLVSFKPGQIDIALEPDARPSLANEIARGLERLTGARWVVALSNEEGAPPLARQREQERAAMMSDIAREPLVRAVLEQFPGAEIVDVRDRFADAPLDAESPPGEDGDDEAR